MRFYSQRFLSEWSWAISSLEGLLVHLINLSALMFPFLLELRACVRLPSLSGGGGSAAVQMTLAGASVKGREWREQSSVKCVMEVKEVSSGPSNYFLTVPVHTPLPSFNLLFQKFILRDGSFSAPGLSCSLLRNLGKSSARFPEDPSVFCTQSRV